MVNIHLFVERKSDLPEDIGGWHLPDLSIYPISEKFHQPSREY